mgnify:CR=1 FL=1
MAGTIAVEFPSDYKFLNLVDLVCGEVVQGLCCGRDEANSIAISVIANIPFTITSKRMKIISVSIERDSGGSSIVVCALSILQIFAKV